MSSVANILKYITQLHLLARELEDIEKQVTAEAQLAQDTQDREEEI